MLKQRKSMNISCQTCPVSYICLPHDLNNIEKEKLDNLIKKTHMLEKGEHLYFQDQKMENFFAVYSGCCKEYSLDQEGNEKVLNFCFSGDIAALESIHTQTYAFSCIALEKSVLCIIPREELFQLMYGNPLLMRRFIALVGQRLKNNRGIPMTTNAKKRIASFLLGLLRRSKIKNSPSQSLQNQIYLPMSQLDIGNLLGITHETVSRTLKHFQKKDMIKIFNKNVHITNINSLEALAY